MDLTLDLGAARYPAAFISALLMALYATPICRRAAIKYGVLDQPNADLKAHTEPTPYLGGVAIFGAFLFSLALTYDFDVQVLGILLSASIIVMIGLFDDLKVLSPGVKLLGQLVAVFVLIKAGIMIQLTFLPGWLCVVLTVLWMVGVTNAINLIDVSDGLAAGVASISGMFLYIIALWNGATTIAMLLLALVGACLGFLAFNRPPARIFMGDTGSMFIGFMLAAIAMIGHYTFNNRLAAVAPVILLGVPIFDTFFVMGARLLRGIPILKGSPDHFAVRLRNHGMSAGKIALTGYVGSAGLGLAGLAICAVSLTEAMVVAAVVAVAGASVTITLWRLGRAPAERARNTGKTGTLSAPEAPE